jgi:hypothetical protein
MCIDVSQKGREASFIRADWVLRMTQNSKSGHMDKEPSGADRRQASNHVLRVLIDAGLTYQKTHGDAVARQFYASRGIPEELATRVLSRHSGHRRSGSWGRAR